LASSALVLLVSTLEQQRGRSIEKGWRTPVRVDDAHLAADDIDELRQRFNPGESKHLTQRGWFATPEAAIRIVRDSPELQHLETAATTPNAVLPNQNGAWAFDSYG
jgi:hypothetical protein